MRNARQESAAAEAAGDRDEAQAAQERVTSADIWLRRVQEWSANMLQDLRADSVLSPHGGSSRWLLYLPGREEPGGASTISCFLSTQCRQALSQQTPCLSQCARARGLWGGPEPPELRVLTYVERQILSLARVYVVVKRIMAKDRQLAF